MSRISAGRFLDAFAKAWQLNRHRMVLPLYPCPPYTELMLGDGGFLSVVTDQFKAIDENIFYHRELYYVDAVILGGRDVFRTGLCYPSAVYALIEHETAAYPEEEMWKLLHWRCPLKVLIMYDWSDEERRSSVGKQSWMENKVASLQRMRDQVDEFQGDEADVTYLFLIGGREASDGPVTRWRYASSADRFNVLDLVIPESDAA